jgi:LuxR family transcriptional regulator of csgAB operon
MTRKEKNRPSSNGMEFYIVGKRRLENELIASYLRRKTGNECFVLEDISHIPKGSSKNNGGRRLVFWDCQKKDLKSLLAKLRTYNIHKPYANHIVLFNVPTELEFGRKRVIEGIRGFFYEHDSLDNFIKGIRAVMGGKLWLSREMMTQCIFEGTDNKKPSESLIDNLSERQIEILALISIGATNEEISEKLYISPHTVKNHLYNIFKKIGVPNRVQAALWAASNL